MKIYVAGPYTSGDAAINVRDAILAGDYLARKGHFPFIPHLTHFWHMIREHDWEFWMEQDREWLDVCDAFVRLKGLSKGADLEEARAKELGIKIYYDLEDVPNALTVKP